MSLVCSLEVCETASTQALQVAFSRLVTAGAQSILILANEADGWAPSSADQALMHCSIPVFGAVFPRVVKNTDVLASGTLVIGLKGRYEPFVIRQLSMGEGVLRAQMAELEKCLSRFASLMVFPDGLGTNIECFIKLLSSAIDTQCQVVGGGAGTLDFVQKPCLFTNEGMLFDAALLVATDEKYFIGSGHGWQKLSAPQLVTRSRGTTVESLDDKPAFEVYRELVETHSGKRFDGNNFFELSKTYPLGIVGPDGAITVRDPIKLDRQFLVCVGEVPEGASIYILKGETSALVASAIDAAVQAKIARNAGRSNKRRAGDALLFDCISRGLFMGDGFTVELQQIYKSLGGCSQMLGALSLGEICHSSSGELQLLNKSTVVALI